MQMPENVFAVQMLHANVAHNHRSIVDISTADVERVKSFV